MAGPWLSNMMQCTDNDGQSQTNKWNDLDLEDNDFQKDVAVFDEAQGPREDRGQ